MSKNAGIPFTVSNSCEKKREEKKGPLRTATIQEEKEAHATYIHNLYVYIRRLLKDRLQRSKIMQQRTNVSVLGLG